MGFVKVVKDLFVYSGGYKKSITIYNEAIIYSYRIVKNFGSKKLWRNYAFESLAKKTLVNPRPSAYVV